MLYLIIVVHTRGRGTTADDPRTMVKVPRLILKTRFQINKRGELAPLRDRVKISWTVSRNKKIVDLFAGLGGLGESFSSVVSQST